MNAEVDKFMQIHCDKCGNCCRTFTKFKITKRELKQIAKHLDTTWQTLIKRLRTRLVGQHCYITQPCPFLENNLCTIYEIRPNNCRGFPVYPIMEDNTRLQSGLTFECAIFEETKRIMKEREE